MDKNIELEIIMNVLEPMSVNHQILCNYVWI